MKKRKMLATLMCVATIFSVTAICQADSQDWSVDYHPHTTYPYNIWSDTVSLPYYSGGYVAKCTSISGGQGRQLTVSSSSCGGISGATLLITTTGSTRRFYFRQSSTGNVAIVISANQDVWCTADGDVHT